MARKTMTVKVLMVMDAFLKENLAIWYPYKGFGRSFKKYRGSLAKVICDLKRNGYLEEIEKQGERYLKMTPKGRLKIIKKKIFKEWDGYWRIIAFDIEEPRKKTRDLFRTKLRQLNCHPIQKSVWITPDDVSAELEELIEILNLKENVDYFLSKALTNEEKYLELFEIKKLDK